MSGRRGSSCSQVSNKKSVFLVYGLTPGPLAGSLIEPAEERRGGLPAAPAAQSCALPWGQSSLRQLPTTIKRPHHVAAQCSAVQCSIAQRAPALLS